MSVAFLLAAVGNVLSTVSIVPHLADAIRSRKPGGSLSGWWMGAVCGAVWIAYGLLAHTPEVGAPGWVTVPISGVLGFWILRDKKATQKRERAKAVHPAFARREDLVTAA